MKQLRDYQQQAVKEVWQALRLNDEPVLLMASVGAGKSLMLASILQTIEQSSKKALCLVNNAELVRNNWTTYIDQGGTATVYCAALNIKDVDSQIIFGTPQSVLNGISKNEPIGKIRFNLIIVDEAHTINYLNDRSCFMRILRHYKQQYPDMRLLGATGTDFRFKGTTIVGSGCLFKSRVGNITTEQLIEQDYLINPSFKVDPDLILDFSKVKMKHNGQFDQKQLQQVIEKSARLTELICKQVIHIMETQQRRGVFLFATTKKHAYEILSHLPKAQSALILGDTPQNERTEILDEARKGKIKYLVNIAIISVGVDIPSYDTIAYLRPTESLVLLVQTIGRALRLSESTNKKEAFILDFAGNIERHSHWDNPILLDALKQTIDKDKPLVILCPECGLMNTEHARRCINKKESKRCDYYFEFKECLNQECNAKNDITARHCHSCGLEIIDPNKKLDLNIIKSNDLNVDVLKSTYTITGTQSGFRVNCEYTCQDEQGHVGAVRESYTPISEKARNVFYGQFVRKHCDKASQWFMHMHRRDKMEAMLREVKSPVRLTLALSDEGSKVKRKYFE